MKSCVTAMGWNSAYPLFAISFLCSCCSPAWAKRFSDDSSFISDDSSDPSDQSEPNEPMDPDFLHPRLTQQFFVQTHSMGLKSGHLFRKEYDIKLHKFVDAEEEPDNRASIRITPSFGVHRSWTIKGLSKDMEVTLPEFASRLYGYVPFKAANFEVRDHDKKKTVRFKIRKSRKKLWLCRLLKYCPSEWYVDYVWRPNGKKEPETRLRYYAVKDQEESSLRFYQSRKEAEADRKKHDHWLAKVRRQVNGSAIEKYDVWVRPLEDAAVILVSVVCVDYADSRAMLQAAGEEKEPGEKTNADTEEEELPSKRSTDT